MAASAWFAIHVPTWARRSGSGQVSHLIKWRPGAILLTLFSLIRPPTRSPVPGPVRNERPRHFLTQGTRERTLCGIALFGHAQPGFSLTFEANVLSRNVP